MRDAIDQQLPLTPAPISHRRGKELAEVSRILDRMERSLFTAVLADLGGLTRVGRAGMTAEQVLRALVVRQIMSWSYDELAFHLEDSTSIRSFCRYGLGRRPPSVGTLKRNIKRVSSATLQRVNAALVQHAQSCGIERGECVRGDSTVMETTIHPPTDSTLLWDGLRKLTKLLRKASTLCGGITFVDHTRSAKIRICAIANARGMDEKRPLYQMLYKHTQSVVHAAEDAALVLRRCTTRSKVGTQRARIADKLETVIGLTHQVLRQTRIRVFDGGAVASAEKLVSLSEPHTDIILKGRRQPQYGHKVFLASGKSGLILDCHVADGNVSDASEAVSTIERVRRAIGTVPTEVSFDGGYASRDNVTALKDLGVREVAFHKKRGIEVEAMTTSERIYKRLRRFRAAIEATIGWLKTAFGLRRCPVRGLESFHAYAQSAVIGANLILLARLSMGVS